MSLLESQFTGRFEPWFAMINKSLRGFLPPGFPTIVCLCGSTRFKQEFIKANFRETMAGKIVLSVGLYSHADSTYTPTEDEKIALDQLHFRKLDLCDECLILNVGGYIGESTGRELEYARRRGKVIRFLEPLPVEDSTNYQRDKSQKWKAIGIDGTTGSGTEASP